MTLLLLLTACAPSPAEAWTAAQTPGLPIAEAAALCRLTGDRAASCTTEVIRNNPTARVEDCAEVVDPLWQAECAFAVAERHARKRERWAALAACGLAGRFYHECLYHAWTFEMQGAVRGSGRANSELESGRELVAYWGQLQTIGGEASETLWGDWWYFALSRNKPASLDDCTRLPEADATRCQRGTLSFVERAVATSLRETRLNPRRKSRICRGGIEEVEATFPDLYLPSEALREAALLGRARGCAEAQAIDSGRPWNPLFLEHRQWHAG